MSIETISRTIPTSGVIESGRGNFCLLLTSSAVVDLRAVVDGSNEGFNGVTGGFLIRRVRPWENLRILGVAGTTVVYLIGNENVERDETDVRLQIASLSGGSSVAITPSVAITDSLAIVAATAAQTNLFGIVTRRRIRVCVDSNNLGICYLRSAGGANNLMELQPGSVYTFEGTWAADVRNDTGGNATFYRLQET